MKPKQELHTTKKKKKNLFHSAINQVKMYVFIKSQCSPCLPFSLRVLTGDISFRVDTSWSSVILLTWWSALTYSVKWERISYLWKCTENLVFHRFRLLHFFTRSVTGYFFYYLGNTGGLFQGWYSLMLTKGGSGNKSDFQDNHESKNRWEKIRALLTT